MNTEKKSYTLHVFDRVYSPVYGYGTIIGNEGTWEVDQSESNSLVLFDKKNGFLHSADNYEKLCDSYIYVPQNVRMNRCYWVDVRSLSTYSELLESGKLYHAYVRLVPFDSLEYKEHPVRVVCKRKDSIHTFSASSASIVNINTEEKILVLADDGYSWVNADDIYFSNELLGTVPHFDSEEATEAPTKEEDVGEDTVDSPSYYKIARLEPNELMSDLMSFEQHEGFLWGNIIKYAYRYGNKGEKAETVKKIRKYCDMLLEVLEPKNELED